MNTSNQIIEIIDALCDQFGIAMDWSAENLLPYAEALCEKIISYEIWTSLFWIVGSLLCLASSSILCAVFRKNDFDIEKPSTGVFIVLLIFFAVLTPIILGTQIHDIITASVFPEMTIYNVISNLLQ